jgi:hypothetical protein
LGCSVFAGYAASVPSGPGRFTETDGQSPARLLCAACGSVWRAGKRVPFATTALPKFQRSRFHTS